MDYLHHYNALISRAKIAAIEGYKEKHHILPRSVGGTDEPSNLVYLTAREHYFAHLLLAKAYGGSHWRAIKFMGELKGRKTSKMYSIARLKWVASISGENSIWYGKGYHQLGELNHMWGRKSSEKQKEAVRKFMTGRKASDETRRKMAEAHRGKKASDETRAKMSSQRKGRKLTPEHKAKISPKGRILSEETKLKMSLSLSHEERSAASKKAWETRRKNKEAPKIDPKTLKGLTEKELNTLEALLKKASNE